MKNLLLIMVLMISGCGMTGDLYLPDENPQDQSRTPVEPATAEPSVSDPQND